MFESHPPSPSCCDEWFSTTVRYSACPREFRHLRPFRSCLRLQAARSLGSLLSFFPFSIPVDPAHLPASRLNRTFVSEARGVWTARSQASFKDWCCCRYVGRSCCIVLSALPCCAYRTRSMPGRLEDIRMRKRVIIRTTCVWRRTSLDDQEVEICLGSASWSS